MWKVYKVFEKTFKGFGMGIKTDEPHSLDSISFSKFWRIVSKFLRKYSEDLVWASGLVNLRGWTL